METFSPGEITQVTIATFVRRSAGRDTIYLTAKQGQTVATVWGGAVCYTIILQKNVKLIITFITI